jgi:hypothetical protein
MLTPVTCLGSARSITSTFLIMSARRVSKQTRLFLSDL